MTAQGTKEKESEGLTMTYVKPTNVENRDARNLIAKYLDEKLAQPDWPVVLNTKEPRILRLRVGELLATLESLPDEAHFVLDGEEITGLHFNEGQLYLAVMAG